MRLIIPLRRRFQLTLSLILLVTLNIAAQTAEDFFHGGAQSYLSNNIPTALEVVTNGLQRFPDDTKLKKLYELLNQQQQQDQKNQDQQQQDKQQDQKQDQKKQDDKKDQQSKPDQAKNDQKKEEQKQQDQQKSEGEKSGGKEEQPKEAKPEELAAHAMTPKEAKQLLDAQKDDEQVLIFQPQGEPKNQDKKLKDW